MSAVDQNVADYLLAGKNSRQPALLFLNETCSYGRLSSVSSSVSAFLLSHGGKKGDRVILIADNSLFWVTAYLGALRAGLVCVPMPANTAPDDLAWVLANTEARFGFIQDMALAKDVPGLGALTLVTERGAPASANAVSFETLSSQDIQSCGALPTSESGGDDLAALMFTSGSTGTPRGVMVSHRNIIANTDSIIGCLRLTESDRIMTVLPFHYCFGTSLLHTHLRVGGSLVVDSRFMFTEEILRRMIETECTGFAGVPSHYHMLARGSGLRTKKFPKLRYVQQAGGRLAETALRELRTALPDTEIFVMYGQTEATARLSYLPPEYLESKIGSIGKGISGVTLKVLDDSGQPVEPGQIGEIVAEGENVALGYWRSPEESSACFRGGRLYTGDLARIDNDGFIYVVDRAKDFLKCAGKRVSGRSIEDHLLRYEGVAEAAVIGVADEVMGEAVKAFVVPSSGAEAGVEEGLRAFCRKNMPRELIPREIVVLAELPKNSAGKVLKRELRTLSAPAPLAA